MGIFDSLRTELVDIIEWVDDSRHTLVWRFPRWHNEIKNGAQLIVRPGQVAVFVKEGKLADVFEPGRHVLSTRNLPVLSTLAGWRHGFDSPFKAEVYFVNTRDVTDLKWGTPNPVTLRDPDFGPIRIRAFGNYSLRAADPRTLLEQLVGTDSSFEMDEIAEMLRAIVVNAFAIAVHDSEVSIVDLAGHYDVVGEHTRQAAIERIDDEYGLDIPQLFIVNISLPAEVEKALDTRTQMNLIGNMQQYRDYQFANALPNLAGGEGGGMAGAVMGLGMGMNMANMLGTGAAAPGGAPALPPPAPAVAWHVAENGQSLGPFNETQLAEAAAGGRLRPDTLVWCAGMAAWQRAGEVPQLARLFAPAPPPPPGS